MDSEKFEDIYDDFIDTEEEIGDVDYFDIEDQDPEELDFTHF